MNDTSIFEVNNLGYTYPDGQKALDGISFDVRAGERIALLGANASGKSTLLHLMNGLYFADIGGIRAFGVVLTEDVVETPPFSRQFRQRVGFLFQDSDAQLFCTSVEDELAFGPLQLRLPREDVDRRIEDVLLLFGIEHLRGRPPQSLSGGEKKKVALASLITCTPSVVLLDEPGIGLDPRSQQWLTEFLSALSRSGVTLIIASHDLAFVAEVTDRALVLSEDHKLICDKPVREALCDIDMLLSANLIHSHMHRHGDDSHTHPHFHELLHDHQHRSGEY